MHQHRLAFAGRERIAAGHVHGHDLMRAQDHFRMFPAFLVPARHLLDDRDVVGAEIGEDVVDPEVDQAFEKIMRSGIASHAVFLPLLGDEFVAEGADAGDLDLDDVAGLDVR